MTYKEQVAPVKKSEFDKDLMIYSMKILISFNLTEYKGDTYLTGEHNYAQREFSGWEFSNETQNWGS